MNLKRLFRGSVPWVLPIYLFLILFVVFPLIRLFVDSFSTADIPVSALNEVALTVDLMEERAAVGQSQAALQSAEDVVLGLQRSITVVDRMVDALGRATFSQDELIARWKQARVDIQAQTEAMRRALDASLSQEDPTAALAEARRARDLVRQVVQLPRQAFSVNFFLDVFRDKLYMKALFNSLSLGVATVITTVDSGLHRGVSPGQLRLPAEEGFQLPHHSPDSHAPSSGRARLHLHIGPRGNHQRAVLPSGREDRAVMARPGQLVLRPAAVQLHTAGTVCFWWRRVTCSH